MYIEKEHRKVLIRRPNEVRAWDYFFTRMGDIMPGRIQENYKVPSQDLEAKILANLRQIFI